VGVLALTTLVVASAAGLWLVSGREAPATAGAHSTSPVDPPVAHVADPLPSPEPSEPPPSPEPPPPASETLRMEHVQTIRGEIAPKSVAATGRGLVFAQNMMYEHTVTVYDAWGHLRATIPDAIKLSRFGYPAYDQVVLGSPVEAAFSPGGRWAYVTNYSMYGPGFPSPGHDECSPADGHDDSFVFRIDVRRSEVAGAIRVGSTPKVVATSPDGRYVLVTNWCSYDLSVVSVAKQQEVRRIPLGAYPRGIAIDEGSRFAYVAVMGSVRIARIDLRTFRVSWLEAGGSGPRALVLSPNGRYLYASLNSSYAISKIDLKTGEIAGRVSVGANPRSMAIAPDGGSLYVVSYGADVLSKIRTKDMAVIQEVPTGPDPIGITYEPIRDRVWVSCYTGSIMMFREVPKAQTG
jgi:YVTN family beta-propeller protein